jgi:hypothetical protein
MASSVLPRFQPGDISCKAVAAVRLPEELELDELEDAELDELDELEDPLPPLPALLLPPPPQPAIKTSAKRPAAQDILALPAVVLLNESNDISHSRFVSFARYYYVGAIKAKDATVRQMTGQAHLSYNRIKTDTTRLFYM